MPEGDRDTVLPLTVTMWSAMRFGARTPSMMVESIPKGAVASPGRRRAAQVTASYPVRVVAVSIPASAPTRRPRRRSGGLANLRHSVRVSHDLYTDRPGRSRWRQP